MRDHIESLRRLLLRLSRVPGLGFLRDHAQSLEMTKATFETRLSGLEAEKQGVQEGLDVVSGPFRGKRKGTAAAQQGAAGAGHSEAASSVSSVSSASGNSGNSSNSGVPGVSAPPPRATNSRAVGKSRRQPPTRAEIRAQKKLLQRKLRG